MKRTADYPSYYDQFRCIADRCPDTCCAGWEVDLDEEAWYRYLVVKGPLGDKLRRSMKEEGEWKYFSLDEKGRCPFLLDSNLCELYQQLGEQALCTTCREHPRYFIDCGTYEQRDLSLGCPEVARIFFSVPALSYVRREEPCPEEMEPAENPALLRAVLSKRDRVLSVLLGKGPAEKADGYPDRQELKMGENGCSYLHEQRKEEHGRSDWEERMEQAGVREEVDDTALLLQVKEMEPLNADWSKRVEALEKFPGGTAEEVEHQVPADQNRHGGKPGDRQRPLPQEWLIRLSCYFVFRYWVDAYYEALEKGRAKSLFPVAEADGVGDWSGNGDDADSAGGVPYDFGPEIRFLNRSLRLIALLYASDPEPAASALEEIIQIVHIFSRQVEFDAENVELLKR